MTDPVEQLSHDHSELNRRVLALGAQLRALQVANERIASGSAAALRGPLTELRESLFLHFAREEEGLFPFVSEHVEELAPQVHVMELAHDAICGALARMVHLATTDASLPLIVQLFDRFENAYAAHAQTEAELLDELREKLDTGQRARLESLIEGL